MQAQGVAAFVPDDFRVFEGLSLEKGSGQAFGDQPMLNRGVSMAAPDYTRVFSAIGLAPPDAPFVPVSHGAVVAGSGLQPFQYLMIGGAAAFLWWAWRR